VIGTKEFVARGCLSPDPRLRRPQQELNLDGIEGKLDALLRRAGHHPCLYFGLKPRALP
jgi:hypothetical protein